MDTTEPTTTPQAPESEHTTTASDDDQVLGDDLVEEISIDGMCGVY